MNTKWTRLLTAMLVLQVVLIAAIYWPGSEPTFASAEQPLVTVNPDSVDEVLIVGEDATKVVLKKHQKDWVVESYFGLPAASGKVGQVLSELANLKSGWPVATTATAAKHFELTDDKFQRKVELLQDGSLITRFYLGTSPGYRKVFARVDAEKNVYAVKFAVHQLPSEGKDWVNTKLTAVPEDSITDIKSQDIELYKDDQNWQLTDLSEGETSNKEEIRKVLDALANLNFQELLGTEAKPEYQLEEPEASFTLALKDTDSKGNKTLELKLAKPRDGDYYVLSRSDRPELFKIPSYRVTALLDLDRKRFYSVKTEDNAEMDLGHHDASAETSTPAS
jgi:hypothetical protein